MHRTLIQPLTAKSMVGNLLAPYYLMRTLLIIFAFAWPWHWWHHKKPAPAPVEKNLFCEPDNHSDWDLLKCEPIDCSDPWTTDGQRCSSIT